MFIVTVWDVRDAEATEPASALAECDSLSDAQQEVREYLDGMHGRYITRWEIKKSEKVVDFGPRV